MRPADGVPPVPIDLRDHGRATWTTVWGGPAQAWLSPQIDLIRVHTVARLVDEIADYQRHIEAMGPVLEEPIVTPTGKVVADSARFVPNPAVRMLRDAQKQLDRELSALGFDPTSRSRLGLAEVKRESILQKLLEGDQQDRADRDGHIVEATVVEILPDG